MGGVCFGTNGLTKYDLKVGEIQRLGAAWLALLCFLFECEYVRLCLSEVGLLSEDLCSVFY